MDLSTSASGGALSLWCRCRSRCRLLRGSLPSWLPSWCFGWGWGLCFLSRRVPVVDHLGSQDCIQSESGNVAIEDQLVIHLLKCGEDAG